MRKLAQTIGFENLLETISGYADSEPGEKRIMSLTPRKPDACTEKDLRQLSQVIEYQSLIPKLDVLEEFKKPGFDHIYTPARLLRIVRILLLVEDIIEVLSDNKILDDILESLVAMPEIKGAILSCINEDGIIREDASPQLKELNRKRKDVRKEIERKTEEIMEREHHILQEKITTTRSGRTVLPIKYDARGEIEGVVVDLSRSGNTAFMEPSELVPLDNKLKEIEIDIEDEKKRILKELSESIRQNYRTFNGNIKILALLDSLKARARYAEDFACTVPEFADESLLSLKECKHPLLMKERDVVPLNINLGRDDRILLVSGPNAGGKTVLLKTVGITVLSAYSNLPITVESGSTIGKFDKIFGIIEDEQSIEENLSTFSSYVLRLKEITEQADRNSLILCDELGGNTDPEEGAALAISVLEDLKNRGSLTIATSHLGTLKFYVAEHEGMQNGAMEYSNGPTYELQMGIPGGSRAISVAEELGLPRNITEKARDLVGSATLKAEELIEELTQKNRAIREKQKEIDSMEKEIREKMNEYRRKMSEIDKETRNIKKKAKEEAREILNDARSTVEQTIKEIRETMASKESIRKYRESFDKPIREKTEKEKKIATPSESRSKIDYEVTEEVPMEISVRGKTREQAISETDRFIDRAILAGYESIRIVHGKGSWILRNAIREKLEHDPRIKSISSPAPHQGGSGVTVAELK